MSRNPIDPSTDRLPRQLPIFPLAGVLLLPRGRLPLNIFEPRYLAMVEDALAGDRMIGMVQPTDPACRLREPAVYGTGCAGRITSFAETEDGRYLITLTGVSRFAIMRELEGQRGYRRVAADWDRFSGDLIDPLERGGADGCGLDRARLLAGLKGYFRMQGLSVDWKAIDGTPDERLVTSLAMICPFSASEKQALLETPDLPERAKLLIALVEMAILDGHEGDGGGALRH
ncbi:peptidase S16 [Azospirillum sp. TSH58]|uniref:LON peptidase substrate-binding domain-containing protein n=1 Tax=Azospirillum sp. TSH58 TaxID=664962 RepID=UPI000D600EF7|nr:LON peptidase substrate-binding domain-containing protein [Azospirillum sp. TSH58]AWJ83796.1 peptidase S16 [Azospirillum sp. TSH58]MCR6630290.1 LON peptidase substrate-binding domain-containing protein [Magnetospirillum sp.]PWC62704.1 peptidase S16 [Azospirillum sp. TSH58]